MFSLEPAYRSDSQEQADMEHDLFNLNEHTWSTTCSPLKSLNERVQGKLDGNNWFVANRGKGVKE